MVILSLLLLIGLVVAALILPRYYLGINDQTAQRRREEENFRRILEMEKLRMSSKGQSANPLPPRPKSR
jgi:hypothetical protein